MNKCYLKLTFCIALLLLPGLIRAEGASVPANWAIDPITLHSISGFTSAGLFVAAEVVSTVHFVTMMKRGHNYRDSIGFDEENGNEALRSAYITDVWNDPGQQSLRWWHIGLVAAGEAFYLYNAFTGIGMWSGNQPGLTRAEIHRYAFFTHALLLTSEFILGFMTSYAVENGKHDMLVGLGVTHAVIGFSIPLLIIGAGVLNIK